MMVVAETWYISYKVYYPFLYFEGERSMIVNDVFFNGQPYMSR